MSRRRVREIVLVVATVVLAGLDLGARVLATNDEARFPLLAQDILARGDWWWPQLGDVLYHNKPPLFAWLVAIASWPMGHVTALTAAVPSAVAAILTAWLVYAAGRDAFGAEAGWYAALVMITTQGFVLQARVAMPDMVFTCCVAGALRAFVSMARGRGGAWWAGFYACVAVAVWTKGLAGLLPLLPALVWAVVGRDAERWRRLRLPLGVPLVLLLLAPWLLRGAGPRGAAMRGAVIGDQLGWFVPHTPTLATFLAPLQNAFGISFPWILVVPFALWQAARFARGRGSERDAVVSALVWCAASFVAIALSYQQRLRYYTPLLPPVALLVGWWLAGTVVRRRRVEMIPWRLYAMGAAALGVLTVAALALRGRLPRDIQVELPGSALELLVSATALMVVVGALAVGIAQNRLHGAFAVAWVGSAVFVLSAYHWEVARRNAANDYAGVAARLAADLGQASAVASWDVPDLALAFYLGRPVTLVRSTEDLRQILDQHPDAVVFLGDAAAGRWPDRTRAATLVTERLAFRRVTVARGQPPETR